MPEREMTAKEAMAYAEEWSRIADSAKDDMGYNFYRWDTEDDDALSVLRAAVEENESFRDDLSILRKAHEARLLGIHDLRLEHEAELAKSYEIMARQSLELEKIQGELARLKAPVTEEERKEMLAIIEPLSIWSGPSSLSPKRVEELLPKIRALIAAPRPRVTVDEIYGAFQKDELTGYSLNNLMGLFREKGVIVEGE